MNIEKRNAKIELLYEMWLNSDDENGEQIRQQITAERLNNAIDGLEQMLGVKESKTRLVFCWETIVRAIEDDRLAEDLDDIEFDVTNNDLHYWYRNFKKVRNRRYKRNRK